MRKLLALFISLLLVLGTGPGALAAEPAGAARFELKQGDGQDLYWLEVSAENITFNAFQFAVNFDPKELVPVDANGNETSDPEAYQEDLSGGWLTGIGSRAETAEGYFTFAGFIMPDQKGGAPLNGDGTATAGSQGVPLFRFRFKKLKEIKTGFSIATDKTGLAYDKAFPRGAALIGKEIEPVFTVKFTYPSGEGKNTEEKVNQVQEAENSLARTERVKGTLAFQLGNAAAVAEGKRKPIYQGENVSAYEENGILYLPLRFAAESLGFQVSWHGMRKPIDLEKDGKKVQISLNSAEFTVDGKKQSASGKVVLRDSRTMVPVDLLETALDVKYTDSDGLAILAPSSAPWDLEDPVARELAADMSLLLSPLVDIALGALRATS